jgi:hypothetical protein
VGLAFTPFFDGRPGTRQAEPKFILFVKLAEDGKLWDFLTVSQHLAHTRRGGWTLFAKGEADFARLPSPDAVIALLEKPQAEDIKLWFRSTPGLVREIADKVRISFKVKLEALPEAKRKAALAYLDVVSALASQLHSIEVGFTLGDRAILLTGSYQFNPGSPIGNSLSYPPGPYPAIASSVRGDALLALAARFNPAAQRDLMGSVLDSLVAVDYPPFAEKLKSFRTHYLAIADAIDGGAAANLDLTVARENGKSATHPRFFYAISGHVDDTAARGYFEEAQLFNLTADGFLKPANPAVVIEHHNQFTRDALKLDGATFDSVHFSTSVNGTATADFTEYLGAVGGNLVVADGEATLRAQLPALRAGTALPNGIRVPLAGDEILGADMNGGKLAEIAAAEAGLNTRDPDVAAQLANLKAEYAAGGPVHAGLANGQARAEFRLTVPYKFVCGTIHLSAYMASQGLSLQRLLLPNPAPAGMSPMAGAAPSARHSPAAEWNRHLANARLLASEARYAEALSEYGWCHANGTRQTYGRNNLRLGILIGSVVRLGRNFPPAVKALADWRAEAVARLKVRDGDSFSVGEILIIDREQNNGAATLAYYDQLPSDSLTRAALAPQVFDLLVEAKRYPDALKARSYDTYSAEAARIEDSIQDPGTRLALVKSQSITLARLAAGEAEALAGAGDLKDARLVVDDLLSRDRSDQTLSVLRTHLARVGRADWLPAPQAAPAATPAP